MEEKKISSDLIRGHIDTIILYSLTDSDKFAQQISDFIEKKSENKYQINQATLYSSLKRLESLKYVTAYWNDSGDGRRKFFKISPLGDDFVKENLSSWTYSRIILDKLMGYDYTPHVYVTQNNSEIPQINNDKIDNGVIDKTVEENLNRNQTIVTDNPTNQTALTAETLDKDTPVVEVEDKKEVNFRQILSGLIKNCERTTQKEIKQKIDITELGKTEEISKSEEVAKFNESIEAVSPSAPEFTEGKADFTDLASKYANEGYKIRVSNKATNRINGNLFINKLRLFTILFFLPFPLIELLAFQFIVKIPIFSSIPAIIFLAVNVSSIIYITIKYFLDKNKAIFKAISFDGILNSSIIVFNILLITFALNFILSVDLAVKFNLYSYLILPIIASFNLIIYYALEYVLFNKKAFKVKKQ